MVKWLQLEAMRLSTGLGNSTNTTKSSVCKPSCSGIAAGVNNPESEQEESDKTCQEVGIQVVSLSSKLKLPKPFDFGPNVSTRLTLLVENEEAALLQHGLLQLRKCL